MTAVAFDAAGYKAGQRELWNRTAAAWDAWGSVLERWLGEATDVMLDQAGVGPGTRVLDVAAGAGGQTLAAARRTGPRGEVLATDISTGLVELLRSNVAAEGAVHVRTAVADAERLELEAGAFDAAICRLGLMFLPDLPAALRGIRAALRRGGRLSAIVFGEPEHNPFFSIAIAVIRRRTRTAAPGPGAPGPFSLSRPGVVEQHLRAAGFVDVEAIPVAAPLRMASAAECARFERESFAALHELMSGLGEAGRRKAWAEIELKLHEFQTREGFSAPCRLLVAGGRRP
jgi:SAM-dependent methyltransferase